MNIVNCYFVLFNNKPCLDDVKLLAINIFIVVIMAIWIKILVLSITHSFTFLLSHRMFASLILSLLQANSDFKFKLYNKSTNMCRQTLLGPMYGDPVKFLTRIPKHPDHLKHQLLAFANTDKVYGIVIPIPLFFVKKNKLHCCWQ